MSKKKKIKQNKDKLVKSINKNVRSSTKEVKSNLKSFSREKSRNCATQILLFQKKEFQKI